MCCTHWLTLVSHLYVTLGLTVTQDAVGQLDWGTLEGLTVESASIWVPHCWPMAAAAFHGLRMAQSAATCFQLLVQFPVAWVRPVEPH